MGEIIRYGAYLPRYRAPLGEIQKFYGRPGRPRAKALATPALDEDALTMAYEASVAALGGGDAPDPVEYTHWMAERMPYFMVPRYIRFVDTLPKTPTERVQKVKLRDEGVTPDTFDREAAGISIAR